MPRVPTPVTQGAQQIGGQQVTIDPGTPTLDNRAPLLDQTGRALQGISKGLSDVSAEFQAKQKRDEEEQLLAIETEADDLYYDLFSNPETGLASMQGQEALDRIAGTPGNPKQAPKQAILSEYEARLKTIMQTRASGFGRTGKLVAEATYQKLLRNTRDHVTESQIKLQHEADLQRINHRIGRAMTTAASKYLTSVDPEDSARAFSEGLSKIESSVRAPDMGVAALQGITDPDQIDTLVRSQQAQLANSVFTQLIAAGDLERAGAFAKSEEVQSLVAGTEVGVQMNTALRAYEDKQKAADDFRSIVSKVGDDPIALLQHVEGIEDAEERDAMRAEFSGWRSARSIISSEHSKQMASEIVGAILRGEDPNPELMQRFAAVEPLAAASFLGRQATLETRLAQSEAEQAHVANGGTTNAQSSDTLFRAVRDMATSRPADFLAFMGNDANIKAFGEDHWGMLTSKLLSAKEAVDRARDGAADFNVDRFLQNVFMHPRLSNASTAQRNSYKAQLATLAANPQVRSVIVEERDAYYNANQKTIPEDVLAQRVALRLMSLGATVDGLLGWDTTEYSLAALADIPTETDLGQYKLNNTRLTHMLLAQHFDVPVSAQPGQPPEGTVQWAMDQLDADERTYANIAALLGVHGSNDSPSIGVQELRGVFEAHERQVSLIRDSGYLPEMVYAIIRHGGRTPNDRTVSDVLAGFNQHPASYQAALNMFLSGELK